MLHCVDLKYPPPHVTQLLKELYNQYLVISSIVTGIAGIKDLSTIRRSTLQESEIRMAVEDHNRIGCEAFLLGIIYMHWLRIQENITNG